MNSLPTKIEPHDSSTARIDWNDDSCFSVPYLELRFHCPCAYCVDELTGKRTLQKETLSPEVKPNAVELIGNYAVKIRWSDQHSTGMYTFDGLRKICEEEGKKIVAK